MLLLDAFCFKNSVCPIDFSARFDAPLLIRLDVCHAESFSNEQGQELDNDHITSYNDISQ